MKPKFRQQFEDADTREEFGLLTGISCTPEEDRTRQEFKDEVNVNRIIKNLTGYNQAVPQYGEVDFDTLDRHTVENQLRATEGLYASLSPKLHKVIPSPAHLVELLSLGWKPPAAPDFLNTPADEAVKNA